MIGYIPFGKGRATLGDDGRWTIEPEDAEVEEAFNSTFGITTAEVGDHHRPFGVALLERAARKLKVEMTLAIDPYPPLPPGAVS